METFKQLSWMVVKNKALHDEKTRPFAVIRKQIKNGKGKQRKDQQKQVEEVAEQVGWIDMIKTQWTVEQKRELWQAIHRDIVSTYEQSVTTHTRTCLKVTHILFVVSLEMVRVHRGSRLQYLSKTC